MTRRAESPQVDSGSGVPARTLLAAASFLWGAALYATPTLGTLMLGGLWGPSIRQIVLLEAVARMALASAAVDSAELRRRGATSIAAVVGFITGSFVVALALVGGSLGDFEGAAIGTAASYALGALLWRYLSQRVTSPSLRL